MENRNEQPSAHDTYTRQARSNLEQAFRRADTSLIGGEADIPLRGVDLLLHLPPSPFGNEVSAEAAAFNMKVPHVADSMLNQKGERKEKYVRGIGIHDHTNLPDIAAQVAQSDDHRVVYRQVFGASQRLPFRALSYMLPALQQMQRIRDFEHGKITSPRPPDLQIVFANHIGSQVNGYDYNHLHTQAVQFSQAARIYIEEFYPALIGSVSFFEDAEYSVLDERLSEFGDLAQSHLDRSLKERILQKGNGLPVEKKFTYAGAHVLMHDSDDPTIIAPLTATDASSIAPSAIISVGGEQERDFYAARFQLRNHGKGDIGNIPTLQIITKHSVPPYTFARGGEIALESVVSNGLQVEDLDGIDEHAKRDLIYLFSVSEKRGSIDSFIAALQGRV